MSPLHNSDVLISERLQINNYTEQSNLPILNHGDIYLLRVWRLGATRRVTEFFKSSVLSGCVFPWLISFVVN